MTGNAKPARAWQGRGEACSICLGIQAWPRFRFRWVSLPRLKPACGQIAVVEKPTDYAAFEKILHEAHRRTGVRIAAYCLMPNHWHLLLWPRNDGELSEVMRWITVTHTQRWHAIGTRRGLGQSTKDVLSPFRFRPMSTFLQWRVMWSAMQFALARGQESVKRLEARVDQLYK